MYDEWPNSPDTIARNFHPSPHSLKTVTNCEHEPTKNSSQLNEWRCRYKYEKDISFKLTGDITEKKSVISIKLDFITSEKILHQYPISSGLVNRRSSLRFYKKQKIF